MTNREEIWEALQACKAEIERLRAELADGHKFWQEAMSEKEQQLAEMAEQNRRLREMLDKLLLHCESMDDMSETYKQARALLKELEGK